MTAAAAASRHTTVLAVEDVPTDCRAALTREAERRAFDWRLDRAHLCWTTVATPARHGWLRRRPQATSCVGCLDERHLAWCVSAHGGDHRPIIVRLDQVSIRDGSALVYGRSARKLASAGWDTEGIEVRGDIGAVDVTTVYLGVGGDRTALRVREAVLETASQTREV